MSDAKPFPRLFTVDEANELLATIRPLMERVSQTLGRLKERSGDVISRERLDPGSADLMEQLKRDESIAGAIQQIRQLVEQINALGCICKGVEEGLIDFPCLWGDEIVFLCWRYGEPGVEHWHRMEEGFAGRKPLLDDGAAGGTPETYH